MIRPLAIAAALGACAVLAPSLASATPGYMTCQIFDGDRNRVFYSNQPIAADSGDVDEAYDVYLKAIIGSGLLGDPAKAQGNCNWEPRKADAAQKGAAFVQHFTAAGANRFGDRYLSDPYVSRRAAASPTLVADAQRSPLPPKPNQVCTVTIKTDLGEAEAEATYKNGQLKFEELTFSEVMEPPGHGPWEGTVVHMFVLTDIVTGTENPRFGGVSLGLQLKPGQRLAKKLELEMTVGESTYIRDDIAPNADGHYYTYHLGSGPLDHDPIMAALNKGAPIHARFSISGQHDTILLNANLDFGDVDAREAQSTRAMDAVALKAKGAC